MENNATFHDLKQASVFITGGGSGIGAALTEGFLEQGARVAFVQRSDASQFCDEMAQKVGARPFFMPCDISDIDQLKQCMKTAQKENGPINVLVNNAANDHRHDTLNVSPEYWDRSQQVNLKSYFFSCQTAIESMKQNGGGSIINFTSISYMMGLSSYPSYVTANSGINGLTRALAREFGPDKIRVNAIAPGWVLTKKQKEMWATPEGLEDHMKRQCLKEHLAPRDIVDAVLFLASNTSRMMTGQAIVVDGGVAVTG